MNVVIIGAGFTGTLIAVNLVRLAKRPLGVTLIERRTAFAQGVAYSTRHEGHLLNVPAGRMSAIAEDEDHFLNWATRRDSSVTGGVFLPRMVFGEYLRDLLSEAQASASPPSSLRSVSAEAAHVHGHEGRMEVVCTDGRRLPGDVVVLAIGNYPPANPPCRTPEFYASDRYRQDPWASDALDVDPDADLLLLGAGLTMVDMAVSLHARGHRGVIHAISRRGLLPQTHRDSAVAPPHRDPPADLDQWPRTAKGLLHGVCEAVKANAKRGVDWRDVVTSLRSVTVELWRSLPIEEKARFLRHVRPFWETHRHRMAPAIGRTIQTLCERGQLRLAAGRVLRYEAAEEGVRVVFRPRGAREETEIRVARVINCTGPDTNLTRVRDPLVESLRDQGLIRPDALGLGLDSDEAGRAIDAQGRPQTRLLMAGPLRRGQLWENIAVPELHEEAHRLALHIINNMPAEE